MFSLVFPGQGSQTIGMGKDFFENYDLVKDLFKEADDSLGTSLSKIILEGPKDELDLTINTQPAIFLISYSIFQVMKKEFNIDLDNAKYFAGHSLGEFTALTVVCCSVVVLAILKNITTYLAMYSLATIRTGVSRDLRNNTYRKLLRKQMNWFTDSRKGDLMSRLTVDLHEVEVSVVGSIEVMFKSPLMIFISFSALLALSWELTLFAMLFLPVSGFVISRVAKKLKKSI